MIVHNVLQGTDEWMRLRMGIPTSSNFDSIVTPKTHKKSASAPKYMNALLAERIQGHPLVERVTMWMDRGKELEADAVAFYEGTQDVDTVRCGFITNDARTIGASPDRLVGDDGLLEIKVPKDHTHVHYLRTKSIDAEYFPQVQGQLWISGRKWVHLLSWHPEMPPALIFVERDEKFIELLFREVTAFSEELETVAAELKAKGIIPEHTRAEAVADLSRVLSDMRENEEQQFLGNWEM